MTTELTVTPEVSEGALVSLCYNRGVGTANPGLHLIVKGHDVTPLPKILSQQKSAHNSIDLSGKVYGGLTVLTREPNFVKIYSNGERMQQSQWLCLCKCGNTCTIGIERLKKGRTCGCENGRFVVGGRQVKHGESASREYFIWRSMRARCHNPSNARYDDYGGRGISVDQKWESYESFLLDMGRAPEGYSLDRKDVNGNYDLDNCKWATAVEQANNKRNTVFLEFEGKKQTIGEWAVEKNISPTVIRTRLSAGFPIDVILESRNLTTGNKYKENHKDYGTIYVAANRDNTLMKFGFTSNVEKRIRNLDWQARKKFDTELFLLTHRPAHFSEEMQIRRKIEGISGLNKKQLTYGVPKLEWYESTTELVETVISIVDSSAGE